MFTFTRVAKLEEQMGIVMNAVDQLQKLALLQCEIQQSGRKVGSPRATYGLKRDGTPKRKPGRKVHSRA